jgi:hypothetical protein
MRRGRARELRSRPPNDLHPQLPRALRKGRHILERAVANSALVGPFGRVPRWSDSPKTPIIHFRLFGVSVVCEQMLLMPEQHSAVGNWWGENATPPQTPNKPQASVNPVYPPLS